VCVWPLTVSIRQRVFNPKVTRLLADKQLNRYSGRPSRPPLGAVGRASTPGDAGGRRPCVEASPAGDAGVCGPALKRHPLVTLLCGRWRQGRTRDSRPSRPTAPRAARRAVLTLPHRPARAAHSSAPVNRRPPRTGRSSAGRPTQGRAIRERRNRPKPHQPLLQEPHLPDECRRSRSLTSRSP